MKKTRVGLFNVSTDLWRFCKWSRTLLSWTWNICEAFGEQLSQSHTSTVIHEPAQTRHECSTPVDVWVEQDQQRRWAQTHRVGEEGWVGAGGCWNLFNYPFSANSQPVLDILDILKNNERYGFTNQITACGLACLLNLRTVSGPISFS